MAKITVTTDDGVVVDSWTDEDRGTDFEDIPSDDEHLSWAMFVDDIRDAVKRAREREAI